MRNLHFQVGDGDCGSTLAQGAAAVRLHLGELPLDSAAKTCLALANIGEGGWCRPCCCPASSPLVQGT